MKYTYDFHIHTALSPCADDNMTPHNIVNMCRLNEVNVIAITDHNTLANCEAVIEVGKDKGVLVIPGMEIECMEEFHNIALFPCIEAGREAEKVIKRYMPNIKNKVHIFGYQYLLNSKDEVIGEEDQLLVTACKLSAKESYNLVKGVGGIIYPAHIDRNSYSILSNLGSIPEDIGLSIVEVSFNAQKEVYQKRYPLYKVLQSSDAHYLEQLCVNNSFIELNTLTSEEIFRVLHDEIK